MIGAAGLTLSYGMEKDSGTTQIHKLGTRGELPDGRVFRYSLANGALGAGQLCQQAAGVAAFDMDLAVENAPAIGASAIQVLLGATTLAADEFADGYAGVNDGPGEGHIYRIRTHPASAASTPVTMTLETDDFVEEAMTTASLVGLMHNPYRDVVPVDLDTTLTVVKGVAPAEIADNEFFWLQTWGDASVLMEGGTRVPVVGEVVIPAVSTSDLAGAIEGIEAMSTALPIQTTTLTNNPRDLPVVGVASLVASVDTDSQMTYLTITP